MRRQSFRENVVVALLLIALGLFLIYFREQRIAYMKHLQDVGTITTVVVDRLWESYRPRGFVYRMAAHPIDDPLSSPSKFVIDVHKEHYQDLFVGKYVDIIYDPDKPADAELRVQLEAWDSAAYRRSTDAVIIMLIVGIPLLALIGAVVKTRGSYIFHR